MSMKGWAAAHRHKGGIIKYLYDKVKALDSAQGGDDTDIAAIKAAIGKSTSGSETGFYKDIKDINTAIGVATSGSETGIRKDIVDLTTAIGTATSGSETGLHKDIADILAAIGDPADPASGTILYRLAELEQD